MTNIPHAFHKLKKIFLRPLQGGGSFLLFMYLLVLMTLLPVYILLAQTEKVSWMSFFEAFVDVYLLAWLLSFLPRKPRRVVQGAAAAILLTATVIDCFVKLHYHTFTTAPILHTILQTNPDEASDYWQSVVLQPATMLMLLPFAAWGAAWWLYVHRGEKLKTRLKPLAARWGTPVLGITLLTGLCLSVPLKLKTAYVMGQPTISELEVRFGDAARMSYYSPLHRMAMAYRQTVLTGRKVEGLRTTQARLTATAGKDAPQKVVLIIGESFNRKHSQLYGYKLPVTPHQMDLQRRGGMTVMTDAVSCWNLTSYVFQHILSLYSIDSPRPWEDYPLLPTVYRRAGYRTLLLSSQYPRRATGSTSDFSGSFFLYDAVVNKQTFDYHNKELSPRPDDAKLLEAYNKERRDSAREMIIFSLIGQHMDYRERVPHDSLRKFRPADYADRPLSPADRQILADYDNATLYNDAIVNGLVQRFAADDAIVIYCPDHGEALFDGPDTWGRTYPDVMSRAEMHSQFEVPLWIWCSEKFRAKRPELVARLNQFAGLPFMTDDLPHLMLSLTDVRCPDYDPARSPLSPRYNAARKRLLRGKQAYEH